MRAFYCLARPLRHGERPCHRRSGLCENQHKTIEAGSRPAICFHWSWQRRQAGRKHVQLHQHMFAGNNEADNEGGGGGGGGSSLWGEMMSVRLLSCCRYRQAPLFPARTSSPYHLNQLNRNEEPGIRYQGLGRSRDLLTINYIYAPQADGVRVSGK